MKKVLHIIDSLGLGGAQTVVKGIFENKKNKGDIFLFSLRKRKIKTIINHKNVFIFHSIAKYSFKPLNELKKLIEKEKIEILHCHLFRSHLFGWILKNFYFPKIKLIMHEHGQIFQGDLYYNLFMKLSQKKTNLFIAVSKATKEKLIEKANINPNKIKILYNFVDLKKFNKKNIKIDVKKEKEKLGIKKDEFIIGFVGRLAKVKGCEYLINALPYLNINYKVLIVGEGPERKKLEKLAKKLKVDKKIIFLGYRKDVVNVYPLFDVLVITSKNESFGIVVIEAQSYGCPVISFKIRSVSEIAGKGAILTRPYDLNEIAKKIEKISGNQSLKNKLKEAGYKNIKKIFQNNYIENLYNIYNEVQ